jgi:hypothetical protein
LNNLHKLVGSSLACATKDKMGMNLASRAKRVVVDSRYK